VIGAKDRILKQPASRIATSCLGRVVLLGKKEVSGWLLGSSFYHASCFSLSCFSRFNDCLCSHLMLTIRFFSPSFNDKNFYSNV